MTMPNLSRGRKGSALSRMDRQDVWPRQPSGRPVAGKTIPLSQSVCNQKDRGQRPAGGGAQRYRLSARMSVQSMPRNRTVTQVDYRPDPLDTDRTELDPSLIELTEYLARNTHEVWSTLRISEGWTWG